MVLFIFPILSHLPLLTLIFRILFAACSFSAQY